MQLLIGIFMVAVVALISALNGGNLPASYGEAVTFIGSAAGIGSVLSFVAQNWQFFQKLKDGTDRPSGQKVAILFVITALISLGHRALITYMPAGVNVQSAEVWKWLQSILAILLGSQAYHYIVNKSPTATAGATNNALLETVSTLRSLLDLISPPKTLDPALGAAANTSSSSIVTKTLPDPAVSKQG